MIKPDQDGNVPPVDDDERLARFIVNSNEFRKDDGTVKPKLFMPYSRVELSVNRHRECTESELWSVGSWVAKTRERTLQGRSDIVAASCRIDPLRVVAKPLIAKRPMPANPNHADVEGYPAAKEDQKSLAQKLAAAASPRIQPPVQL